MSVSNDIQIRMRREDAEVANFPNLVETVARLMITNRSASERRRKETLAPSRRRCRIQESRTAELIIHIQRNISRRSSFSTRNGKRKGSSEETCLSSMLRLQEAATSLNSMNDLLRRALDHLDMETPKFESPSSTSRKSEALDIDGLVFRLEQAEYHHECPSWWVQGKELSRLALLQHRSVGEWAVFELDPMTGGLRSCTSDVQFDSREWVPLFSILHFLVF